MSKTTRNRKVRVAVIVLIGIAACVLLYSTAKTFLSGSSMTDTEIDIHTVEQLIKLAQAHPAGTFPQDDLDPSIQNAFMQHSMKKDASCWSAMQKVVSKNDNNYTISGTDPFRQYGRDVDNSLVEVRFQDGSKAAFTFYQQTMVACSVELAETK